MTSYPGAIKSFVQVADGVDLVSDEDVNDAYNEIEAIETELGINPPDVDDSVNAVSAAANLALRLDHIANIIKTISGESNWYDDPEWSIASHIRYVEWIPFSFTTAATVADGHFYWHVPAQLDGLSLVEIHAEVITAGTTNTQDMEIYNITDSVDMLATTLTIDTTPDTGSDQAATPAVIASDGKEIVAENDVLRLDIDAIHDTPAQGLIITLGFS